MYRPKNKEEIDMELVKKDTKEIYEIMNKKKIDKKKIIEIMTKRSFFHLEMVYENFFNFDLKNKNCKDLIDYLKISFKDSSETGYACIITIYYAARTIELFADLLAKALNNPGPNYELLSKIIVERNEIDLGSVVNIYGKLALKKWLDEIATKNKHKDYVTLVKKLCGIND